MTSEDGWFRCDACGSLGSRRILTYENEEAEFYCQSCWDDEHEEGTVSPGQQRLDA